MFPGSAVLSVKSHAAVEYEAAAKAIRKVSLSVLAVLSYHVFHRGDAHCDVVSIKLR